MATDCIVCTLPTPPELEQCEFQNMLSGGTGMYGFIKCGQDTFTLITSAAEWAAKKTAGNLFNSLSKFTMGGRPASTPFTVDGSSCCPPSITNYGHSLEIIDRNAQDPTLGSSQILWHNYWKKYYGGYILFWVSCAEMVSIVPSCYSYTSIKTEENNNKAGIQMWTVKAEWNAFDEVVPVYVPGIVSLLLNTPTP